MENQKQIVLLKDLPKCPKGRVFKEDISGDFFHSMSDDEAISKKFKNYKFTKLEVENNPDWFSQNNDSQKKTLKKWIAEKLIYWAIRINPESIKLLFNYRNGRPR